MSMENIAGKNVDGKHSRQESSRGHKFSIFENFLPIRDCTSQTLSSFRSALVGACLPQTLLSSNYNTAYKLQPE